MITGMKCQVKSVRYNEKLCGSHFLYVLQHDFMVYLEHNILYRTSVILGGNESDFKNRNITVCMIFFEFIQRFDE